ncbi:hypothetical protein ABZ498_07240 [Streptomyces lavendulocolor]|uniref:hypothetical protein n=1 Tax=Streptomyces lavendulocolor TaxID=67316 RepID=UPI003404E8B9
MKINKITTVTAAVVTAAIFSTGLSGSAMAADRGDRPAATASAPASDAAAAAAAASAAVDAAEAQKLAETLKVLDAMPDSVLAQGDAAAQAYLAERLPQDDRRAVAFGWTQKLKCGAAITAAIAGGAVPVAKLLKLKAFIKKVGSVKEAASLLIRVSKGEEKISELGATLGGLASAILGIDMIKKHCR